MERKIYLNRYRVCVDQVGIPVVIRRSAGEATFKADDTESGEPVALQVVPLTALDMAVRDKLETEARAAKELSHINIPVLRDFGFEADQIVYVTEYFDGTTAEDWIKAQGPMPASVVLRIASQVVGALGAATFHGIVHHAVNPSNIMLVPGQTAEGQWPLIKVLNFVGVAPALATTDANATTPLNPADFASPEQLENGAVDFPSQMYSLGCTLWFLLKGMPPSGGAAAVQHARGVAGPVRHLLARMLSLNPSERPLDPLAFQEQIQDCTAQIERRETVATKFGLPTAAPAPVPVRAAPILETRPRGPLPWKPLALAALLLGLATTTALVLASRAHQHQAIGVPVGVPDSSAAPAAPVAGPAQSSAPIAVANNSPASQDSTEPAVLTSNAGSSNEVAENASPSGTATAAQSTQVASNETAPSPVAESRPSNPPVQENVQPSAPVVASNSARPISEPPPPAEGPTTKTANPPQAHPEVAAASRSSTERARPLADKPARATSAEEEDVQKDVSIKEADAVPEKSAKVARAVRPPKKVRVANNLDSAPPVPRGSVRARYLGTTPDGNLVFGLPNDEHVYAAPPAASTREERRRRRQRPVTQETIDNLPVLPALPPDE